MVCCFSSSSRTWHVFHLGQCFLLFISHHHLYPLCPHPPNPHPHPSITILLPGPRVLSFFLFCSITPPTPNPHRTNFCSVMNYLFICLVSRYWSQTGRRLLLPMRGKKRILLDLGKQTLLSLQEQVYGATVGSAELEWTWKEREWLVVVQRLLFFQLIWYWQPLVTCLSCVVRILGNIS